MGIKVFIGSPFWRLKHLRERVHHNLRSAGHAPWCFEFDAPSPCGNPLEVIEPAIRASDLVVTVFERRPGKEHLRGTHYWFTEYEWLVARRAEKPICLFLKGRSRTRPTRSLTQVIFDTLPTPDFSTLCETDDEIVDGVLRRANEVASRDSIVCPNLTNGTLLFDRSYLEHELQRLEWLTNRRDYSAAGHAIESIPLLRIPISDRDLIWLYSRLLRTSAGIAANTRRYRLAKEADRLAITLLIDAGFDYDMLAAIQELSGILNMAGEHSRAELWNAYGFERAHAFPELQQAFWDSRGSIMRATHPLFARRYFRRAFQAQKVDDPYLGSRLATALVDSPQRRERDEALRLIDALVRSTEGTNTMTRAIVLREAIKIGLKINELRRLPKYVSEASTICQTHGFAHTLATIHGVVTWSGFDSSL